MWKKYKLKTGGLGQAARHESLDINRDKLSIKIDHQIGTRLLAEFVRQDVGVITAETELASLHLAAFQLRPTAALVLYLGGSACETLAGGVEFCAS